MTEQTKTQTKIETKRRKKKLSKRPLDRKELMKELQSIATAWNFNKDNGASLLIKVGG